MRSRLRGFSKHAKPTLVRTVRRLIVLTDLQLATGLAIGDACMLSKSRVIKNDAGWNLELRPAKTGGIMPDPE